MKTTTTKKKYLATLATVTIAFLTTPPGVFAQPVAAQAGASISVTLFVLVINAAIFALPFLLDMVGRQFSNNIYLNLILRRCCFILGFYFMVMNSAIMGSIAEAVGLGVQAEMYRYMWFFGWAGYLMIFYTGLMTIIDVIGMWKVRTAARRMGDE